MIKEFLEVGKIVGTHGVRGTMRMDPWSDDSSFLEGVKVLYLSDKTELKISSAKAHGNLTLLNVDGVDTIEKAEKFRNKVVLIKRSDAKIEKERYFVDEIIGCQVFDKSDSLLGVLCDVSKTGANDVWHIKKNNKEYLVPAIESVVISVDIENNKVIIEPLEGIFDEN